MGISDLLNLIRYSDFQILLLFIDSLVFGFPPRLVHIFKDKGEGGISCRLDIPKQTSYIGKPQKRSKFFLVARPLRGGGDKGLATKKI